MSKVEFKDMKLHRAVLEFRYSGGFRYWDICGECIFELQEKLKSPIAFHELNGAEECVLIFERIPTAIISFGYKRAILSSMRLKNVNFLKDNAPMLLQMITSKLGIGHFDRIGLRYWYIKKMEDKDSAEDFVNNLDLCNYNSARFKGFGEKVISDSPKALVVSDDYKVNIRISPGHIENSPLQELGIDDEYAPEHCFLADFDFYKEDVNPEKFEVEEFIRQSHVVIRDNISKLLDS